MPSQPSDPKAPTDSDPQETFEKIITRISNPGLALCAGDRDHDKNIHKTLLEAAAGQGG